MVKTTIVIADAAIELIPAKIQHLDTVKKISQRRKKKPYETILDSSKHYAVMRDLQDNKKRGRPDIVHFSLLSILGAPMIKEKPKNFRILVHCYDQKIIEVNPKTRIPRNYNRFLGLMEQVFIKNEINTDKYFLIKILKDTTILEEVKSISPENRILFTSKGKKIDLEKELKKRSQADILLVFGGFPYGTFSNQIANLSKLYFSISSSSLDAWTAVSRVVYEREKTLL